MCLWLLVPVSAQAEQTGVASVFYDTVVACPPFKIDPYKAVGVAHKTLPCGTKVEVTNLETGQKATTVVVDRGPCTTAFCNSTAPERVKRRILDMLPAFAAKIGSDGLTRVKVVPQ